MNGIKQNGTSSEEGQNGNANTVFTPTQSKHVLENLSDLTQDELVDFLANIDAVMFDCDGVLWWGNTPIPKSQQLVKKLRALNKKVFFITNNSTKTREEFVVKFNKLGYEATLEEIVSTSYLAALYLKEKKFKKKVYVVGTTGVTGELDNVGIESLPIGPDNSFNGADNWTQIDLKSIPLDPEVGAVIVGFDFHINYAKMFKSSSYLSKEEVIFIATNTDESFPATGSLVAPGTGSIVQAVATASGRAPIVMGKPSSMPFDFVKRSYNIDPARTLMVGDRGNTDIAFANKCGLWSLLVLTGVNSIEEARNWHKNGTVEEKMCVPNFCLASVTELFEMIERCNI